MNTIALSKTDSVELVSQMLKDSLRVRFKAAGASMQPFIRDGDIIVVEPILGRNPRIGDVLLHLTPARTLAAHRFLFRCRRDGTLSYAVRGDSHAGAPSRLAPDQILGRVVTSERDNSCRRFGWTQRLAALAWIAIHPWRSMAAKFLRRVRAQRNRRPQP